jgi:hypothetical protein
MSGSTKGVEHDNRRRVFLVNGKVEVKRVEMYHPKGWGGDVRVVRLDEQVISPRVNPNTLNSLCSSRSFRHSFQSYNITAGGALPLCLHGILRILANQHDAKIKS